MKLSDLLIDYCEIDGMRIVSILNHDAFFAIMVSSAGDERARYLKKRDIDALRRDASLVAKLKQKYWKKLEDWNYIYVDSLLNKLICESLEKIANPKDKSVMQDDKRIVEWFMRNEESGNSAVMYCLGRLHEDGCGVEKDDRRAVYCYDKAARAGNADAMNKLASIFREGRGVTRDLDKARYWLEKASQQRQANTGGIFKWLREWF